MLGRRWIRCGALAVAMTGIGLAAIAAAGDAKPIGSAYQWSPSIPVASPEVGRQRVETALATDSRGRVWLSYLDAEYKLLPVGKWIAFPRKVVLLTSSDHGHSFEGRQVLSEMGGDESLAVDGQGGVYASWIQYGHLENGRLYQKAAVRRVGTGSEISTDCLPWDDLTAHDQSQVYVGGDGTIHLLATDIGIGLRIKRSKLGLLYAKSHDGGKTWTGQQRLTNVGQLPQMVASTSGLLIAGTAGYLISPDNGISFSGMTPHTFGDKLARVALSPDRKVVYVVGDSRHDGLWMHSTADGGKTWQRSRVDRAATASAWRYPAVHVDRSGRVHVVWMDDRDGHGVLYHAFSDDSGKTFSVNTRVSDVEFPFYPDAPPPPPVNQAGNWIGDYLSITSVSDKVVVAWSDQRAGMPRSTVFVAVGTAK